MRRPRGRGRSDEAGGRAGPDHNRDINPRKHGRTDANPAVRLTSAERPDSALPLQLESKCMPSPGRQISGMAGARNPVDLPKGYHTPARGQSCTRIGRRFRRGLPPGRRAVGLRQVDGMPHEPGAVWRSKLGANHLPAIVRPCDG